MWAYTNYQKDQKEDFEEKKDIFEALKPWLDNEQYNYVRKKKEERDMLKQEDSQEKKNILQKHLKELGIKLPDNMKVSVNEDESSEVVE